ncbi:hypothetical protein CC1G_11320 [Coprinopsis cinerea okayama7|uniref:Uncharacterized protein n=1 Tax=Coprinopsis cinerea (strain Okayama-7 / 130 / ATCC MYA-4618 / FGSC 9003) TaxID=240176 RepID=A8P5Q0_COPC7|nr:hypothetical protein CC1G_11320 [Coprinopsis cinerea okayama7\|eukprot:XP_001838997.2 hypothetical protein CC1G_11320 [Coprinopsis cinerea okayama7\
MNPTTPNAADQTTGDLDQLPDHWTEEEHQQFDNLICNAMALDPHLLEDDDPIPFLAGLLAHVLTQIKNRTKKAINSTPEDLLLHHPPLKDALQQAWRTRSFKKIRNLKILRKQGSPIIGVETTFASAPGYTATFHSWKTPFRGSADATLLAVIKAYLQWTQTLRGINGAPYSNLVPIINSSGTGKSRVVDQLGRSGSCFVIPLCLRRGNEGYPPPDSKIRDWLLSAERSTAQPAGIAAAAFLRALLKTATEAIQAILSEVPLGAAANTRFTQEMSDGSCFGTHPRYREEFYERVTTLAEEYKAEFSDAERFNLEDNTSVNEAAVSLLSLLGEDAIAVLSFDEAHELALPNLSGPSSVTMWAQIRKGLRAVRKLNVVGLYLSTSGKYKRIVPEPDISSRVLKEERILLPPFTELGLNQLALPLSSDGPITLQEVTTLEYVAHLGRPLFATRYDAGDDTVRSNLLEFARQKLVSTSENDELKVLGCIAVRFAVEFRASALDEKQADIERTLVENHMRYCVKADSRLRMITIAPSEPLLAEAAFEQLCYYEKRAKVLAVVANNINSWGVDKGVMGEFVMSMIWMAARDDLVVRKAHTLDRRPWNPYGHSVVTVSDWMKQLLPAMHHSDLDDMLPSIGEGAPFTQAFAECRIWCNHFIQVQSFSILNTRFLCALLSNGIGVLCARGQPGIDMLWIGLRGDEIREDNLVLILGQAKNDRCFTANPDRVVLDTMDPINLRICDPNRSIPVIRMVFALASEKPGVTLLAPPTRRSPRAKASQFTSYDFWFAGAGPSTFGCVTSEDAVNYGDLLASSRSLDPYDPLAYTLPPGAEQLEGVQALEKQMKAVTEMRLMMQRAANSMRMGFEPHFPTSWQRRLFRREDSEEPHLPH